MVGVDRGGGAGGCGCGEWEGKQSYKRLSLNVLAERNLWPTSWGRGEECERDGCGCGP